MGLSRPPSIERVRPEANHACRVVEPLAELLSGFEDPPAYLLTAEVSDGSSPRGDRYERVAPGESVHVDIDKLGNLCRGRRSQGPETPGGPQDPRQFARRRTDRRRPQCAAGLALKLAPWSWSWCMMCMTAPCGERLSEVSCMIARSCLWPPAEDVKGAAHERPVRARGSTAAWCLAHHQENSRSAHAGPAPPLTEATCTAESACGQACRAVAAERRMRDCVLSNHSL